MTEDLEWEEWDGKTSFAAHMLAGSVAGIAEHTFMFPVDTLKTHIQCIRCGRHVQRCGVTPRPEISMNMLAHSVRKEGVLRLWRGVSTMFGGCVPAHALYFSIFEQIRSQAGRSSTVGTAAAGAVATCAHDLVMTPMDLVKQRLQLGRYEGVLDAFRTIYRTEGPSTFYRSFSTTLLMNIPYACVMVAVNEDLKQRMYPDGKYEVSGLMLSGALAGGFAAAVTTPLDMIKTRLQTSGAAELRGAEGEKGQWKLNEMVEDEVKRCEKSVRQWTTKQTGGSIRLNGPVYQSRRYIFTPADRLRSTIAEISQSIGEDRSIGMMRMASRILREEGITAFFKGVAPRMMVSAPSVAVSWTVYETMKSILSES
mmetsp:Transcript_5337/g.21149  ORF Transcript_5337/g.21149 Transcript_5337/m.21149 type:complete len:367 (+) Transcript_5337:226-1326(+)